ncbi:RNA polymerase sigma factor [Joostella sp.]|uniref:RNA polymerase sigma factor n=1 Tax=Joostella sp. TaxID=2231138 RepID=UPI003A915CC9
MKRVLKIIQLNSNEQKLIEKARKGSRDAQHKIYLQFSPKMLSVCRYYIKDIHYAEDVMITAFYKVFKKIETFKSEGSFEGWIRKIMVRECLSFIRSKKEIIFLENENDYPKEDFVLDKYHELLEVEEIQVLIDALPDGYKSVFLLFAVEGYSHKEIALQLNIAESTSKSQLFKARRVLQENIKEFKNSNYESQSS